MARSLRGRRGARGKQGIKGPAGKTGRRGPVGPATSKSDIIAAVADQFRELGQRLDTQLTRMAQLQRQLDEQHKEVVGVRSDLSRLRDVLENIIKTAPE